MFVEIQTEDYLYVLRLMTMVHLMHVFVRTDLEMQYPQQTLIVVSTEPIEMLIQMDFISFSSRYY